ncbi:MAG TPA: DUF1565 domain-containing protein [Nostocaceae cyanobacterium]|nr:DUF1565 domain-containing protein [Nostocaceae cyanobacterium]
MKNQNFHISKLTLRTGLAALLVVGGSSTLLAHQATANTKSILTAQANATVIYVNPVQGRDTAGAGSENAPYKTITFAISQAQPGTVIQLVPGSYTKDTGEKFPLLLKPNVTLKGNESNKGQGTIIIGGGFYTSRTFARQDITILANDNTTIAGLTVTNPNQRGTGLWVESSNPSIKNNTFTNSVRDGVFVTGTGNPAIENNVFIRNTGNGVSIARAAQGIVRNNLFQNTGFGLAIGGTSTPLVENNRIEQNVDGIFISESAQPVLRNNIIENNKRDGIVVTVNGKPNLGTNENLGGNRIRSNTRYDLNNATKTQRIAAVGNDIDQKRIFGAVDFVAAEVKPPTGTPGQGGFNDVSTGYWAKGYIEALAAQNIIAGFPDGTFRPNEPVTRAQFATIVTKAFAPSAKRGTITFRDVQSSFWAFTAIRSAYQGQFVSGYPDGTFKPQQQIPRVQALVALANGLGLSTNDQSILGIFTDAAQIPSYALGPVAAATAQRLVVNYPTAQQLDPNREATRAEIAAFVYQALVNAGRAPAIASPYVVNAK